MASAQCQKCGAVPDFESVKEGNCKFCGAALPHAVKAAAKAQLMQELLKDEDGDGVPDALQALQEVQKLGEERAAKEKERELTRNALSNAKVAKLTLSAVLLRAGIFAVVFGLAWCLVTCSFLDTDPWLGQHAAVFCPSSCEGCEGPYTWHSWSSSGTSGDSTTTKVYCQHDDAVFGDWMVMMDQLGNNERFEVDGGLAGIIFSSIGLWLIPGLFRGLYTARKRVAEQKASIPELEARLRKLDEELAGAT